MRLDAPVAGRAPIIQGKVRLPDVGKEVGAFHRQAAKGIGRNVVFLNEVVLRSRRNGS